jgi:hypothetical protein
MALPPVLLIYFNQTEFIIPHFWILFSFLSGLTFLVIVLILFVQRKNAEIYTQAFLAGTTFKLLAALFFVLIFLRKNHVDKLAFAADFFYIYFLNMAFEVYGLLRNLRNQNLR